MSALKSQGCPVPVCGGTVAPRQLMCRACWQRVPARLKSKVGATWRAWKDDMGDTQKFRDYRITSQDAIDAAAMR